MNVENYTLAAPMCACGNIITKVFKSGKPGKFCGPCMDRNANRVLIGPRDIECAQCGKSFTALAAHQKYCHPNCKYTARDRAAGIKPMQYVKMATCNHCRKDFKPSMSRYSTYCSRDCSFAAKAGTPSSRVWIGKCKGCDRAFVSRRAKLYCTSECWAKPAQQPIPERPCKCCGTPFVPAYTGGGVTDYCGKACGEKVAAAARRICGAKRKAVIRNATVETVDPFIVFARDKWKCQLCGIKTPQGKRGTYADDAPELDHIITLSEGGGHSYRNTQCACRKCNRRKAGHSMGQLLLIG